MLRKSNGGQMKVKNLFSTKEDRQRRWADSKKKKKLKWLTQVQNMDKWTNQWNSGKEGKGGGRRQDPVVVLKAVVTQKIFLLWIRRPRFGSQSGFPLWTSHLGFYPLTDPYSSAKLIFFLSIPGKYSYMQRATYNTKLQRDNPQHLRLGLQMACL